MSGVASKPEAIVAEALSDRGRLDAYGLLGLEIAVSRILTACPTATLADLRRGIDIALTFACIDRVLVRDDAQASAGLDLLQTFVERRGAARPAETADD